MQDWLKLHTDLLDNPDVALMSAEDYQIATFLWMLCRKENFSDGRLVGWSCERLAYRFRKSLDQVTRSVTLLSRGDIQWLVTDENGVICVTHYAERQYGKPSAAPAAAKERKRRQRMRQRGLEPEMGASRHTPVTPLEEKRGEEKRGDKKDTSGAGAPQGEVPSESKHELTELEQARTELENEFAQVTGLALPERKTDKQRRAAADRWWNPLDEIYRLSGSNVPAAKKAMAEAVARMDTKSLTYSTPASIVSEVRYVLRKPPENTRVRSNGSAPTQRNPAAPANGTLPKPVDPTRPKFDAYVPKSKPK